MRSLPIFALLFFESPAAAASVAIDEPSSLALFGLGVLGVIVGRQTSRRKRD